MTSWEFLRWLHARLINVYNESENTDFVLKLADIADMLESQYYEAKEERE